MSTERLEIKCDTKPYFQYQNRIASFLDWNLDWEINKSKPSPEQLARAGFFSYTAGAFLADNVTCPYCDLSLDAWEPGEEPLGLHQTRSPACRFVQKGHSKIGGDGGNIKEKQVWSNRGREHKNIKFSWGGQVPDGTGKERCRRSTRNLAKLGKKIMQTNCKNTLDVEAVDLGFYNGEPPVTEFSDL
ncbi:hypothetical protein FJTKL_06974 [Diaporthe vaccinii]|uniref:Uncharacterized protein n=1 Tax=Diaporthe vaccinii TaxID=105482 RepID=A0ABR4DPQ4_9PEZI